MRLFSCPRAGPLCWPSLLEKAGEKNPAAGKPGDGIMFGTSALLRG
jgi:hypothetical protein